MAVERVKDIFDPYLGGMNYFFSIPNSSSESLFSTFKRFVYDNKEWYEKYEPQSLDQVLERTQLIEIENWQMNFSPSISEWTSDKKLESVNGKNGYYLSEFLVKHILTTFFESTNVKLYKISDGTIYWHWTCPMSDNYVFEAETKLYFLGFGEDS